VLWPGHLGGGAGCWVALIVTLVPVVRGSTRDPPHKQLLMDMWWVLVRCALGKVVGGCQHEAAGKRWVGCVPALYGPLSAVPPITICSLLHPSHFLLHSSPRVWGACCRGDSSSFFPKKSINLMVSMIE
jgi:hypothetical protein